MAVQLIDKVDVRLCVALHRLTSSWYGGFSVVVAVSRGADGDVVVAAGTLEQGGWVGG